MERTELFFFSCLPGRPDCWLLFRKKRVWQCGMCRRAELTVGYPVPAVAYLGVPCRLVWSPKVLSCFVFRKKRLYLVFIYLSN
jgi:hypothetical protein